jgi:hypothetical protein
LAFAEQALRGAGRSQPALWRSPGLAAPQAVEPQVAALSESTKLPEPRIEEERAAPGP